MKTKSRKLFKEPAALTFFVTKTKREIFFIKNGKIEKFGNLTLDDARMLRQHLEKDTKLLNTMDRIGIYDPIVQLQTWIRLNFPTIHSHPDFIGSKMITKVKPFSSADIIFNSLN